MGNEELKLLDLVDFGGCRNLSGICHMRLEIGEWRMEMRRMRGRMHNENFLFFGPTFVLISSPDKFHLFPKHKCSTLTVRFKLRVSTLYRREGDAGFSVVLETSRKLLVTLKNRTTRIVL